MNPRILVVEDEFLIRMSLSEALTDAGFAVLEAETAELALSLLDSKPPVDLLITDIQMPGQMDGTALARVARARHPYLPIVYMTGCPSKGVCDTGLDVFIHKPYAIDDVCQIARRLITSRGAAPVA